MKKIIALISFLCLLQNSMSEPVFEESKRYLITICQSEGAIHLGNQLYPIGFTPQTVDPKSMSNSYYWLIRKEPSGYYSIRNVANNQYIRYDRSKSDRTSLLLTDRLQSDQSTLFAFIPINRSGSTYYAIRPAAFTDRIWNRRTGTYDQSFYPIGTYGLNMDEPINNELFRFVSSDGVVVTDDGIKPRPKMLQPSLGNFETLLDSISFNGKSPAWDSRKRAFLCPISEKELDKDTRLNVCFKALNEGKYELLIDKKAVKSGETVVIKNLSCSKIYPLVLLKEGKPIAETNIRFTTLPIVQIYSSRKFSSSYKEANIIVTETDKDSSSEKLWAQLRIRGAMASMMPKSAYAVKLINEESNSINRSFFGFRSDNNWILDAAFIDPSRCRNRVTTDLWLDFSTPPYYSDNEPNMINGTRGKLIEAFVNDRYQGLYVMTEKVDRKQLDIKKFILKESSGKTIQRGALYKAANWSPATLLGQQRGKYRTIPPFNNRLNTWASFEFKYPDLKDGEPIDWTPLYNAIRKSSYATPDKEFSAEIADYFDLPVFRDYYLLLDLILATDNQGKNTILSIYDQTQSPKLTITPWDLDGTWGRDWGGSSRSTPPTLSFGGYCNSISEGMTLLFTRLSSLDAANWNTLLAKRYRELRASHFSYESLTGRFEKMFETIRQSGAGERESEVWQNMQTDNELKYISSWIKDRLDFLDRQYLGMPYRPELNGYDGQSLFTAFYQPLNRNIYVIDVETGTNLRLVDTKGSEVITHTVRSLPCIISASSLPSSNYTLKADRHSVTLKIQ